MPKVGLKTVSFCPTFDKNKLANTRPPKLFEGIFALSKRLGSLKYEPLTFSSLWAVSHI